MNDTRPRLWTALVSGCLGGLFFYWLVGTRVLTPTEAAWAMRGDWQWHFLGWHFFRHEPWHVPPGVITTYLEPVGSALGYTDSIPLVALILKPFSPWLPNPFNYLGLWFCLCYILQGFVGTLALATWTPKPALQILGGCLLFLLPTLLARMAHPALASHWLLLWALWLNWRALPPRRSRNFADHAAIGLASGLIHPYLAVMVLAILAAAPVRRAISTTTARHAGIAPFLVAVTAVVAGWWASGLFTVRSSADLMAGGVGRYSMNLLGPITPAGRSFFLPDLPVTSVDQIGEGYQYLGAGVLFIAAVALAVSIVTRARPSLPMVPLLLVLTACALYSLSPRVTFGSRVLADWGSGLDHVFVFRTTGRFFWPAAYALTAAAAGYVAHVLRPSLAMILLAAAVMLQVVDLQKVFLTLHDGSRNDEFFMWDTPLTSPDWATLLPQYRHIRMYSPEICRGPAPAPLASVAYLAGIHGLGLNDGFAARTDRKKVFDACVQLRQEFERGVVHDDVVYLVAPSFVADFERRAAGAVACRVIDRVPVCHSARPRLARR